MLTDEQPRWSGYCKTCNGPIIIKRRLRLAVSHIAYWVWMRLPYWLALGKFGYAILPYAGEIAFACHCKSKVVHGQISEEEAIHAD